MKTSLQDCIKYATFRKNIQLVDLLSFQVFFFFFFVQAPRNTSHLHRGAPVHSGRKAKLPGHRASCFFFNYSRQTSNKNFLNFNNKKKLNQYSIGHLFYHNSLEQFRQNILWYLKKEKGIFNSKLQVILHKI